MRKTSVNLFKSVLMLFGFLALTTMYSCEEDEATVENPIASFQFAVSESNYLEVAFTNYSTNATSYSWNFGDSETSTEENPTHVYVEAGSYEVVLTATNSANVDATYSATIEITDPNAALIILTGGASKTWKLYREGTSMGIGPDVAGARSWWALENDGSRPCLYKQEFTFNHDGTFVFDDMGSIWGEGDVFKETAFNEICFPADAANMLNFEGTDVSAWLGGTHAFSYDPFVGKIVVTGTGAYLGITKTATTGYVSVPQESITYDVSFEELVGYDLMTVSLYYADLGQYWDFTYVSYSDESLEPELVEEGEVWEGEDLADITPSLMKVTFASRDAADLVVLDTIASGSTVDFGADDPADATAAKVGKFNRTDASYQELQLRTYPEVNDILFDNLTKVSLDVYVPSTNDYSTTLTKGIVMGFGDISETKNNEWWTDLLQFEVGADTVSTDVWTTYTFDLTDAKARVDLDMFYIGIGGGGHAAPGTFYVRNLIFE